jgi:hypothetical protein
VSEAYLQCLRILDRLRSKRAEPGWVATLEDVFGKLTPEEQEQASGDGWRSWPDLHGAVQLVDSAER